MEFTYFLPDAVQEQAKERLHRAARESEMRKRMFAHHQQSVPYQTNNNVNAGNNAMNQTQQNMNIKKQRLQRPIVNKNQSNLNNQTNQMNSMNQIELKKGTKRKLLDGGQLASGNGPNINMGGLTVTQYNAFLQQQQHGSQIYQTLNSNSNLNNQTSQRLGNDDRQTQQSMNKLSKQDLTNIQLRHTSVTTERKLFDVIKDYLLTNSRDGWNDFLKIIELFSSDTIQKKEFFVLLNDLFETNPLGEELFEELKRLLISRQDYDGKF